MAALDFPSSPSLNDYYVANGRRWQWNGTAWQRIPDPGAQGVQGAQGFQGAQGSTGPTGAQGASGATNRIAFAWANWTPAGLQGNYNVTSVTQSGRNFTVNFTSAAANANYAAAGMIRLSQTTPYYGLWNGGNGAWSTTSFYCQLRAGDGGDPGTYSIASAIFFSS